MPGSLAGPGGDRSGCDPEFYRAELFAAAQVSLRVVWRADCWRGLCPVHSGHPLGTPALKWLFETRFLQWIGMLSYSLYMWHLNLMLLFSSIIHPYTAQFGKGVEDILLWAFVWLAIVPFCYLFYKLIEEPGIRLGARLTARKFEAIQLPPLKALLSPKTLLARLHKS